MYRERDLQDCLFGLVGWEQNQNPDYPILPDFLIQSDSGLYFQNAHPLVCIENLDQALKNYSAYAYPAYTEHADYSAGTRVRYATDNKIYESIGAIVDAPVILVPGDWTEINLFAQRLESLTRAAINKVASKVFIQKKMNEVTKSIFESVQLFDGAGSIVMNKEVKAGRFVGFALALRDHADLTAVIRRLGTQFSDINPDFELYVYHSSQEEAVAVIEFTLTKANSFEWSRVQVDAKDFALRYMSDNYNVGGTFYVGYYEDDLVGQAINRGYDFGMIPQNCCNRNYEYWSNWSPYITVTPIEVSAANIDPAKKLWDIDKTNVQYSKNYGLNLDLSLRCDVTDFFCRERSLFSDAISKQVAYDVIEMLAFPTRNNPISKMVQDMAFDELKGSQKDREPGITKQLENSIKALSFDFSDLNSACLPCNSGGYGPVWGAI